MPLLLQPRARQTRPTAHRGHRQHPDSRRPLRRPGVLRFERARHAAGRRAGRARRPGAQAYRARQLRVQAARVGLGALDHRAHARARQRADAQRLGRGTGRPVSRGRGTVGACVGGVRAVRAVGADDDDGGSGQRCCRTVVRWAIVHRELVPFDTPRGMHLDGPRVGGRKLRGRVRGRLDGRGVQLPSLAVTRRLVDVVLHARVELPLAKVLSSRSCRRRCRLLGAFELGGALGLALLLALAAPPDEESKA